MAVTREQEMALSQLQQRICLQRFAEESASAWRGNCSIYVDPDASKCAQPSRRCAKE